MTNYNRPDNKIFANQAKHEDVEDFPDLEKGWALAFEKYKGVPPMEWFNALGKRTDLAIAYLLQKGIPDWSKDEDYPKNAYVQHQNKLWVAAEANRNKEPIKESVWLRTGLTQQEVRDMIPPPLVKTVNGKQGDVWLNYNDVGSFDRNRNLADANAPEVRKNLALGDAALRMVGEQSGQLMQVGAFGLGLTEQQMGYTEVTSADQLNRSGFYFVKASTVNLPAAQDGYVLVLTGNNAIYQKVILTDKAQTYSRVFYQSAWSSWQSHLTNISHPSLVYSVNGKQGEVSLTYADVGSFDRNKNLADANPELVRRNLALGSAAVRNVGEQADQVMAVGAFGLGLAQCGYSPVTSANDLDCTGFYYLQAHVRDLPQVVDCYMQVQAGKESTCQEVTLAHSGEKYTRVKQHNRWSAWQVQISMANQQMITIPIGAPIPWPGTQAPFGWLKCNGASFDKHSYPLLAKAYPSGYVPDLRGEFIRGWDDGRNVDSGRQILSGQSHLMAAHKHVGGWGESYNGIFGRTNNSGYQGSRSTDFDNFLFWTNDGLPYDGNPNPNGVIGHETRPRNIAFLYIVRAA